MSSLEKHPNEIIVEETFNDAINWLGVVGEYDHGIPKPDIEYNRSVDRALGFMATKISEGDFDAAHLLADLERQARLATSESSWISDEEEQRTVRTNQMYMLARLMNGYAGAHKTSMSETAE